MKTRILFLVIVLFFACTFYYGFSPNDNDPKWNQNPRTTINLNSSGNYIELPQGDNLNYTNEPRYYITPQGTFAVGPNFRVHPRTVGTQSETPITRHPINPNIFFASANTFQGGQFSTGCYVSTDGGVTWVGNDTLGSNIPNSGDPAPMIDFTGRLLISFITVPGSMGASYSTNNGLTFSAPFTFPGASSGFNSDKNLSATDGDPTSSFYGRSYTVYTDFGLSNRIYVSYTTNQGVSWSAVAPVSPPPSAGHHHQGCDITVRPDGGGVYVVWANCTTNGQNSTEDSLGFAKSFDGGVTWSSATNHAVNTNGIRAASLFNGIRANGFPRIDVDRTCGPLRHNVYVVMAEKSFAPAVGVADIVLMKSTDLGITYSRTKVNQNSVSTSYDYCPAVMVDETGAINVCYYSTRNVPTNDSAEIYLSRSTDGGTTFTDVKVSDHKFKPLPISGTAGGYQGDYIGITSGGAGKILPYWCEGSTASGGRYQAWTALIDVTTSGVCEDFSCSNFPPSSMFVDFSGTNYWSKQAPSAYGVGAGSSRFNSWSATSGTIQSLTSFTFPAAAANTYLTFDEAYSPWSSGTLNIDSLIVESSINGGTSYTILAKLWGGLGANVGPLNTAPPGGQFVPANNQWAPKIYLLPANTNKIRLRGNSGFGNDIWVDNVCVQVLAPPATSNIFAFPEGFYRQPPPQTISDTINIFLHRADFPNIKVDSVKSVILSTALIPSLFSKALSGTYYISMKHRNSIETWSRAGGTAYTRGSGLSYDFVNDRTQAFDTNEALVDGVAFGPYYGLYGGEIKQDSVINLNDITLVFNASAVFTTGYDITDVTGDNVTSLNDIIITFNNSAMFIIRHAPAGAEPEPVIISGNNANADNQKFENDAQKQKYEMSKNISKEEELKYKQDIEKHEQDKNLINEIRIKEQNQKNLLKSKTNSPTKNSNSKKGLQQ